MISYSNHDQVEVFYSVFNLQLYNLIVLYSSRSINAPSVKGLIQIYT